MQYPQQTVHFWQLPAILLLIFAVSCNPTPVKTNAQVQGTPTYTPIPGKTPSLENNSQALEASSRTLPTLYPTKTPKPSPTASITPTPKPTVPTVTPIPLDTVSLRLRYTIPALSLDRNLKGTVGAQLTFWNELSGRKAIRSNQAPIMIEIQSILPEIELAEMPADCPTCVLLEYEMPLNGESGSGWLQDARLLASIENFMTITLGPHFPPGTILGLRKGASAYDVAQTVAVRSDGVIWRWLATDSDIEIVEPTATDFAQFLNILAEYDGETAYSTECRGRGRDQLFFSIEGKSEEILIQCPELSLPTIFVPTYLQLSTLLDELESGVKEPHPSQPLPLEAMLFYYRGDGNSMTLYPNGNFFLTNYESGVISGVLTETTPISLTMPALSSTVLSSGGELLLPAAPISGTLSATSYIFSNLLAIRNETGVHTVGWDDVVPNPLLPALAQLNSLFTVNPFPTISNTVSITVTLPITN